jgi:N-acetylglucosaminyldiphosphoundecaprenol N-acetyl-beta-D-mannosaminyltransferase
MNNEFLSILGYRVYASPLKNITVQQTARTVINTLNPHSYCTAKKDPLFNEALQTSDILLPDGTGIGLAARLLKHQKILKIAGSDIHIHLLDQLNKKGGKVFYLGAMPSTLEKIGERIRLEYPNIQMDSYSPPFKPLFSDDDNTAMIAAVNAFGPDLLFVGMTAPKQEKWVHQNKQQLNARIICSIGAVFDFYAGTVKRPHWLLVKFQMEWLGRLIKEPRRMWRRNFISTPCFLWSVVKEIVYGK